ncbi:hypothetical protein ACW2QC_06815 [Virgibacillus sp. FSP13]
MLIKFFRPEHVKDFMKGKLFFKNTGYFIDLENEQGEKGIGDKYEGAMFRSFNPSREDIYLKLPNGKRIKLNVERAYFTERYEAARQFQLTCFTGFTYEDFMIDESENTIKLKEKLIEELKGEFPNRVPILITDEEAFFSRVSQRLSDKDIASLHGYVKYFNEYSGFPLKHEIYEEDITNAFFYKREFFKSQKEYRIITRHPVEGDSLTLELGDITDIIYNLGNIDNVSSVKYEMKK